MQERTCYIKEVSTIRLDIKSIPTLKVNSLREQVVSHYGKPAVCRVFPAHGKRQETHSNAFAMRFSRKHTAKAAQKHLAW
jgi:hypothetical protein